MKERKNYKDPNHRLASLNGSAYSDSLYNEGDIVSVVRIATDVIILYHKANSVLRARAHPDDRCEGRQRRILELDRGQKHDGCIFIS